LVKYKVAQYEIKDWGTELETLLGDNLKAYEIRGGKIILVETKVKLTSAEKSALEALVGEPLTEEE